MIHQFYHVDLMNVYLNNKLDKSWSTARDQSHKIYYLYFKYNGQSQRINGRYFMYSCQNQKPFSNDCYDYYRWDDARALYNKEKIRQYLIKEIEKHT